MKLLSIQVGKVQTHEYNGKDWTTGYFKKSVSGAVWVSKLNVEGDDQHHKKFHGGEHRAILMYNSTHYDAWENELGQRLPYGSFGENFTVEGLDETQVAIGDIYQIGDALRVQVSQPRQPCNQIYQALGIRGIQNKVAQTRRTGWYLRVLDEGHAEAGMSITLLENPHPEWTITRAHEVMDRRSEQRKAAFALSQLEALEPGWRGRLAKAAVGI